MSEEEIKTNIKNSMDALTSGINAESQQRLNQIRMTALQGKHRSFVPIWSVAGAFAAIVLVVLLLINNNQQGFETPDSKLTMFEDLELLAGDADTEFYQDLEFLAWLDANNLLESEI
ncbi:MAG: hypothetical protein ACSHWU_03845 [Marinicella sp.]